MENLSLLIAKHVDHQGGGAMLKAPDKQPEQLAGWIKKAQKDNENNQQKEDGSHVIEWL